MQGDYSINKNIRLDPRNELWDPMTEERASLPIYVRHRIPTILTIQ